MRTFEKKMCGKKMCEKKGAGRTMMNKMNRVRWCCKHMMILWLMVVCLGGCKVVEEESPKIRDLEYVLVGEELIPEQLKSILEEKKENPFQLTYSGYHLVWTRGVQGKERDHVSLCGDQNRICGKSRNL